MTQSKMETKKFGLFFVGVLALLFAFSAVSAATVFSESFNGGTLTGWTVTNNPTTLPGTAWNNTGVLADAHPGNGSATPSNGTTVLQRTISTSGFTSITVKYDRQLIGFETAEEFRALWTTDGVNFNVLEETLNTTPDDASFVSKTFNLSTSANNNANFQLRFECTSDAQADGCKLDNVIVEGNSGSDTPLEATQCSAIGNPGQLDINKIDFQNNGMGVRTFGQDDEWFPMEEIEVEIEVENNGNDDVDDVSVEWGLWDAQAGEWVIDIDEEDELNIKDGDKETFTVTFTIDDDLDVNLEDLNDGDHYKLYVVATGTVDSATSPETCASDFETASIIIESDFVVLTNVEIPEIVQCGETVQVSADVWNIGDGDQDEVSVEIFGRESVLGVSETVEMGDIDAFDRQPLSFSFDVPRNLDGTGKTFYALTMQVLDEDGDVYQNDFDDDDSEFIIPFKVENCGATNGTSDAVAVSASLVSGGSAGGEMVVKATILNNDDSLKSFAVSASGFTEWADGVSVDKSTLVLNAGQSGDVVFTFDVKESASGAYTFYIEAISGSEVTRQPVSVTIEPRNGFEGLKSLFGVNWPIWVIGFLNLLLVIIIIVVAIRVAKK